MGSARYTPAETHSTLGKRRTQRSRSITSQVRSAPATWTSLKTFVICASQPNSRDASVLTRVRTTPGRANPAITSAAPATALRASGRDPAATVGRMAAGAIAQANRRCIADSDPSACVVLDVLHFTAGSTCVRGLRSSKTTNCMASGIASEDVAGLCKSSKGGTKDKYGPR